MKKYTKFLLSLSIVLLLGITAGKAQSVVPKPPPMPSQTRPPQPSPAHVWIPIEWDPYEHKYMRGFWEVPPQHGKVWVAGRWNKTAKGYEWLGGRWK